MKKMVTVRKRLAQGCAISGVIALAAGWALQTVDAQIPQQGQVQQEATGAIESLSAPGQRLLIRNVSQKTGLVTFAGSRDGIELPLQASVTPEERALTFVDLYGGAFGLADRSQLQRLEAPNADELGITHARFQQVHRGIPIRAAEFFVHMKGTRVLSANGFVINDLPEDLAPTVAPTAAVDAAREIVEKYRASEARGARYAEPRLEIFNKSVLADGMYPSRLAWFVEATNRALREYIWIDAHTGTNLLNFSQLPHALNRQVYNMGGASNEGALPGTLCRSEGMGPVGDSDCDNAYAFSGSTYQYFFGAHGRDSFDGTGGAIISSVHFGVDYGNAFWNGTQMVYGDGYASADDVVGHELTHAVTERTADLLYYYQSGAMNESMSDVFGETIDLDTGNGNDAAGVRWLIGEDLPIGAIRNMMNPNAFGDPGKMSDAQFFCVINGWTNPNGDSGGVHSNSGVPNHAYALLVDGGVYNGLTVTGIGSVKAGKTWYRALANYMTSGSGFMDSYAAINQACSDLIGTSGITAGDCTQAAMAMQAVEMNTTWGCAGAVPAPVLCPSGTPSNTFFDGFEAATGNWTAGGTGLGMWSTNSVGFARVGSKNAWGTDPASTSDRTLAMTNNLMVPANARMHFDSSFEFESNGGTTYYDGGVLEYSTNSGASWTDAASLIDVGRNYNGTLTGSSTNPLAGRQGFVATSYGYTGTRLNLGALGGQNVRFRFRVGADSSVGSLGWIVDNVAFYTCIGEIPEVAAPTFTPPAPLTFGSAVEIRIATATLDATIRYTTDGTDPAASTGTPYSGPVPLTTTTTLKARAFKAGLSDSPVTTGTYTSQGTLTGVVRNSTTNALIVGATLMATGGYSTTTDATGSYTMQIPVGTYIVTASKSNYSSTSVPGVVITSGGTTTRDFVLAEIPLVTFVVNSTLDAVDTIPGNGICATAGAACTLRAAIQEANAQGGLGRYVITLPAALYTLTIAGRGEFNGATGDLNIQRGKTITIDGASAATTTIDANGVDRAFQSFGGSLTLNGVTVQNGNPLTAFGGCFYVGSSAALVLNRATVKSCNSGTSSGGGVIAVESTVVLTDTTITQNVNTSFGGGVYLLGGEATINRTTISGNSALFGAGLLVSGSANLTLSNTTISGNTATSVFGGAVQFLGGTSTFANVTVASNSSAGGGAVVVSGTGRFQFRNTIIANNTGGASSQNCSGGAVISLGNNVEYPGTTCGFSLASDSRADPLLGVLADNGGPTQTHALGSGSAALGLGDTATCVAPPVSSVDQRGFARPSDACDVGAYQFGAPVITTQPTNQTVTAGRMATFTAAATGTPTPTVQWQVSIDGGSNWRNIEGATSTTYSLTGSTAEHGKRFRAVFENSVASVTSHEATLTVRSVGGSDFNGDTTTDIAVYRQSTGMWYIRDQSGVQFGGPGQVPVAGDYNGDGTTDIAVYQPSNGTWYVLNQLMIQFGDPGDIPVPGDYDGNGTTDLAVYRPSTGNWYVRNQLVVVGFGGPDYVPVVADYNGDGTTDIAVYRPATGFWYVRNQFNRQFGGPGQVPVPADFNGDGSADLAVYQPATGYWYVSNQFTVQFGDQGDVPLTGDFNGDGTADVAVYRPATGQWFVRNQFTVQFGDRTDVPVPRRSFPYAATNGDYNGDNVTDLAVYRPSTGMWFVRNQFAVQFGDPTDKPVPADYNGDGRLDVAVFRPSTRFWYVRNLFAVQFGQPGDVPVPGDYDGDGLAEPAIYRPSTGQWYIPSWLGVPFGSPGDIPVPGDYNGDGATDVVFYRPSTGFWYVCRRPGFGVLDPCNQFARFGDSGDIPVPGDYNGDGLTDLAVFRPSSGTWYVRNQFAVQFGDSTDTPVPGDYNGDGTTDVAVYRPSTGFWYVRSQFAIQFGNPGDVPIVRIGGPQ